MARLLEQKGSDVWSIRPGATVYEALEMLADKGSVLSWLSKTTVWSAYCRSEIMPAAWYSRGGNRARRRCGTS